MGIPATIFLTTGYIDTVKSLWPQEIYDILTMARGKTLDLRDQGLGIVALSFSSKSSGLFSVCCREVDQVRAFLKGLSLSEKERLMGIIRAKLGVSSSETAGHEGPAMLSWQQVSAMHREGLVGFGAHTVSHAALASVPLDEANQEISDSIQTLRDRLGMRNISFAYPYGGLSDFNQQIIAMVKNAGASCAVTTIDGFSRVNDDVFQLKRIACNLSRPAFGLALSGGLSLLRRCKQIFQR